MNLELQATPAEVMRAVEALQDFAQSKGLPEKTIFSLSLALEEFGSNVVNHALRGDAEKQFHVAIEHVADAIVIELRDGGPEFDPTAAAERKMEAEDDDLPGGWGIQLARRSLDEISYQRVAGENVLRMTKRFPLADEAK